MAMQWNVQLKPLQAFGLIQPQTAVLFALAIAARTGQATSLGLTSIRACCSVSAKQTQKSGV